MVIEFQVLGEPKAQMRHRTFKKGDFTGAYDPSKAIKKDYNQSQEKRVVMENKEHKIIRHFDSMKDARTTLGMSKTGMINAIKNNLLTRKGYYFRYAEKDETTL